jgi:hypothetical protein
MHSQRVIHTTERVIVGALHRAEAAASGDNKEDKRRRGSSEALTPRKRPAQAPI